MYRSLTAPVVALALLLGGSAGARAELVPPSDAAFRWQFNFSPTVNQVAGSKGGSVTFTNDPYVWATGNDTYVNPTLLKLNSNQPFSSQETIVNGAYGLTLTIKVPDYLNQGAPIESAVMTFGGVLSGQFSNESSGVNNTWTDTGPHFVDVGGYRFTVELTDFARPGPPSQPTLRGSITAHITVDYTPKDPDPDPQETPEPASLLLCGLGAALGGLAWWKRRKPPEA